MSEASDQFKWDQSLEEGSISTGCNFGKRKSCNKLVINDSAKTKIKKKTTKAINEKKNYLAVS